MYDPNNPYASPSAEIHPVAAQWLGQPSASLRRVATGLGIILAANLLFLVLVLATVGAFAEIKNLKMLLTVIRVIGIGSLVAMGLNVAGSIFCLSTPAESGAKGMIIASVIATLIAVVLYLGGLAGVLRDVPEQLVNLLNLVAGITFLLFLRLLSRFIGRYDLGRTAASILIWEIISFFAAIAGFIVIVASLGLALLRALTEGQAQANAQLHAALQRGAGAAAIGFLVVGIAAIIALVMYVRYLILLNSARRAILTGGRG